MSWETFLHKIFSEICFCLWYLIKTVRLRLAAKSINGWTVQVCELLVRFLCIFHFVHFFDEDIGCNCNSHMYCIYWRKVPFCVKSKQSNYFGGHVSSCWESLFFSATWVFSIKWFEEMTIFLCVLYIPSAPVGKQRKKTSALVHRCVFFVCFFVFF